MQADLIALRKVNAVESAEKDDLSDGEQELLEQLDVGPPKKRLKQSTLTGAAGYVARLPPAVQEKFRELMGRWVITRNSTLSFNCVEDPLLREAFQVM